MHPDLLLLDEPTNHLDVHALTWLQVFHLSLESNRCRVGLKFIPAHLLVKAFLESWEKTVVIVSHDRGFLNKATKQTCFIHRKKLWYYGGNYDTFLKVHTISLSRNLPNLYDLGKS